MLMPNLTPQFTTPVGLPSGAHSHLISSEIEWILTKYIFTHSGLERIQFVLSCTPRRSPHQLPPSLVSLLHVLHVPALTKVQLQAVCSTLLEQQLPKVRVQGVVGVQTSGHSRRG